jgi:hypothetical protein
MEMPTTARMRYTVRRCAGDAQVAGEVVVFTFGSFCSPETLCDGEDDRTVEVLQFTKY